MAMGIVSDSDFEKETEKLITPTPTPKPSPAKEGVVVDIERGRPKGSIEVPQSVRNLIGISSVSEGRDAALDLAKQFGVSPSSASAYAVGATSTKTYDERPNVSVINGVKLKIQKKAKSKLLLALNSITPEKMMDAKPRDLSGIARDMSAIYKDMEPESESTDKSGGKEPFVVYSPIIHNENKYEVIVVKE